MTTALLREDFFTNTWKRLTAHLEARLFELRKQNDSHMDLEQTASVRGSIDEVKRMLALADEVSAGSAITPGDITGDDHGTSDF